MQIQQSERLLAAGNLLRRDAKRIFDLICKHREKLQSIDITLRGGSMCPAIPKGASIRIQVDYKGTYVPGQVVAFLTDSSIMVHRLIYCGSAGKAKNYFLTRGDAMRTFDPPVHIDSILGPVVAFEDNGNWRTPPSRPPGSKIGRSYLWFCCIAVALEVNVSAAVWLAKRYAK
jgi:hypothetical protein